MPLSAQICAQLTSVVMWLYRRSLFMSFGKSTHTIAYFCALSSAPMVLVWPVLIPQWLYLTGVNPCSMNKLLDPTDSSKINANRPSSVSEVARVRDCGNLALVRTLVSETTCWSVRLALKVSPAVLQEALGDCAPCVSYIQILAELLAVDGLDLGSSSSSVWSAIECKTVFLETRPPVWVLIWPN